MGLIQPEPHGFPVEEPKDQFVCLPGIYVEDARNRYLSTIAPPPGPSDQRQMRWGKHSPRKQEGRTVKSKPTGQRGLG